MTDTTGKLFVLEASGAGRLFSINPDGSDKTSLVTGCAVPDGVAVDVEAGHIYWTNMGKPPVNDGSIERVDLDGGNRTTIVPSGGTYTPKQLHLDTVDRKLYWGDREGMRVMRCDLDGSNIETLVQTGVGEDGRHDETKWCVGVAVDHVGGHLYWTQKGPSDAGLGRILRAGIDIPEANPQRADATSRWSSRTCPSPSTSKSSTPHGCCIGPTVATRRMATRSIGLRWTASSTPNPRSW